MIIVGVPSNERRVMQSKDTRVSGSSPQDPSTTSSGADRLPQVPTAEWSAPWNVMAWLGLAVLLAAGGLASGCTAVQSVSDHQPPAGESYLELEIEPETAELYVDGDYKGKVAGWAKGIVPLEPGQRRVKFVAEGYVTRRFDLRLEAGESKKLTLEMERKLRDFATAGVRELTGRCGGYAPRSHPPRRRVLPDPRHVHRRPVRHPHRLADRG